MSAQPNLVAMPPEGPGVHVLVIGVSAYRHLPGGADPNDNGERSKLKQLSGPAKSASNFAGWMYKNHFHSILNTNGLKSLRVLLSPANGEDIHQDILDLITQSGGPSEADSVTVNATIAAFRNDCENDRKSMVVVYVCGHGVQVLNDGARMLLEDYGTPNTGRLLDASLDLNSFYKGLYGNKFPQTQLWFYDCCGQTPAEARYFENMEGGIGLSPAPGFADVAPIYMSASEGTLALGKDNENSFFCQSILWALEHYGAARNKNPEYSSQAQNDYIVTTNTLNHNLKFILTKIAHMNGGSTQFYRSAGRPNPGIFHEYRSALQLPARITVTPPDFVHNTRQLLDPKNGAVSVGHENWPIEMKLKVGLYILTVMRQGEMDAITEVTQVEPSSDVTDLSEPALNKHHLVIDS